ncbi:MAG: hypothetical protein WDN09_01230 [bacterium]
MKKIYFFALLIACGVLASCGTSKEFRGNYQGYGRHGGECPANQH